jgi:hypothetical protein
MTCNTRSGRHPLSLLTLAVLALPVLAGCGGTDGSGGASSTLNLGITDGPIDSASSVVLSITGVELQPSGGKAITYTFSSPMSLDLLQDENGKVSGLLSGVSVPPGNYQWMRLLLNIAANGTVADSYIEINGAQYPLMIPSGAQTGLKLVQGFTLTANHTANYTIDFMLAQSISATAPPGQSANGQQVYFLVPAMRLVDDAEVGTIGGAVALSSLQTRDATAAGCLSGYSTGTSGPLPNAHVYIFSGQNATLTDVVNPPPTGHLNPVVASLAYSSSSDTFTYEQPFLQTGDYTVAIACGQDDPTVSDIGALVFLGPGGVTSATGVNAAVAANQTTPVDF